MYVETYTYIYTCKCTYKNVHSNTAINTNTYTYKFIYLCMYVDIWMHRNKYAYINKFTPIIQHAYMNMNSYEPYTNL